MNIIPFTFTEELVNLLAMITEKVGRIEASQTLETNLHLRKSNRIQTIKSTTAIENNTLSLKQVSDVIDGKVVIGKADEILEVKNTFKAYEHINSYDVFQVSSFLKAHGYITAGLIDSVGAFRRGDVAVFEGQQVIHMGARPQFVPDLVKELFAWGKTSKAHPLIISSVIHLELETIHPFEDGNGRIGRLWQTAILSKWKPIFEYIPIETLVYKHQADYYKALELSRRVHSANPFITFMLEAIDQTLDTFLQVEITDIITDIITDKLSKMERQVLNDLINYLLRGDDLTSNKAQELTGKSAGSVKKYLSKFVEMEILIATGQNKGRVYQLNKAVIKNNP